MSTRLSDATDKARRNLLIFSIIGFGIDKVEIKDGIKFWEVVINIEKSELIIVTIIIIMYNILKFLSYYFFDLTQGETPKEVSMYIGPFNWNVMGYKFILDMYVPLIFSFIIVGKLVYNICTL